MKTSESLHPDLDKLQIEFNEFSQFYKHHSFHLDKLKNRISWYKCPDPYSGKHGNFYSICLTDNPSNYDDSHIVAHELSHCILWEMGYPYLEPRNMVQDVYQTPSNSLKNLCSAITNMVYNPMIEHHLKKYYSDLYSKDKETYKNSINQWNLKTINDDNLFEWSCLFVGAFLTLKWLSGDNNNFENWEYSKSENGKIVAPCANKIIKLLDDCGFNSSINIAKSQDIIVTTFLKIAQTFDFTVQCNPRPQTIFLCENSFKESEHL